MCIHEFIFVGLNGPASMADGGSQQALSDIATRCKETDQLHSGKLT